MKKPLLAALLLSAVLPITAGAALSISIDIAPPVLPVYVQPPLPGPGYIWTPGYWRWSATDGDYFWVPGTWILPPYTGALWTPGYWGWSGGYYAWHGGYWGTHIGFYGGVNYGFGYVGHGYQGGYWNGGVFNYNRSVNNVNTTIVHNVYNTSVVENNTRTSFNGGQGGIAARPTGEERAAQAEQHTPPTVLQRQHEQVAMHTPEQRASVNHGNPSLAASARPAEGHFGGAHPVAVDHPHPAGGPQHAMAYEPPQHTGGGEHAHAEHAAGGEHAHVEHAGGGEHAHAEHAEHAGASRER